MRRYKKKLCFVYNKACRLSQFLPFTMSCYTQASETAGRIKLLCFIRIKACRLSQFLPFTMSCYAQASETAGFTVQVYNTCLWRAAPVNFCIFVVREFVFSLKRRIFSPLFYMLFYTRSFFSVKSLLLSAKISSRAEKTKGMIYYDRNNRKIQYGNMLY